MVIVYEIIGLILIWGLIATLITAKEYIKDQDPNKSLKLEFLLCFIIVFTLPIHPIMYIMYVKFFKYKTPWSWKFYKEYSGRKFGSSIRRTVHRRGR